MTELLTMKYGQYTSSADGEILSWKSHDVTIENSMQNTVFCVKYIYNEIEKVNEAFQWTAKKEKQREQEMKEAADSM
jgi:hypothetical protein